MNTDHNVENDFPSLDLIDLPQWDSPLITKLQLEDAESGQNVSENGAFGS